MNEVAKAMKNYFRISTCSLYSSSTSKTAKMHRLLDVHLAFFCVCFFNRNIGLKRENSRVLWIEIV